MPSSSVTTKTINTTAYRIFRLFQWLHRHRQGLSLAEINQRFVDEPNIGKPLSEDTIGLYLNTLRRCGCVISRPTKQTNHCYQLRSHQFHSSWLESMSVLGEGKAENSISKDWLETIVNWKLAMMARMSPMAILAVDNMIADLLDTIDENYSATYFHNSCSLDYRGFTSVIGIMEGAIAADALLFCGYKSPRHGGEHLYIYPRALEYERGVLYLTGFRLGSDGNQSASQQPSRLRVDRILYCEVVTHGEVGCAIQQWVPTRGEIVELTFYINPRSSQSIEKNTFQQISSSPQVALDRLAKQLDKRLVWASSQEVFYQMSVNERNVIKVYNPREVDYHCRFVFEDAFLIIQMLLQLPFPVSVNAPQQLVEDYRHELSKLANRYHIPLTHSTLSVSTGTNKVAPLPAEAGLV